LAQTIAAFEQFSDTIRPSIYFGEQKNLGKVTVMTYQSFNKAYEAGLLTKDMFNAVIRDESHRTGGKTVAKNLHDFCYGSDDEKHMAVFDLSATPRVDAETLVYSKSVVDGIGEGLLVPVAARRIFTDAQIIERTERFAFQTDFTEGEIGSLIYNQARNEIIVDEILSGLRGGRRTIVRCLPGDKLAHPGVIKDMLEARGKVKIMNPYMEDYERRKPHVAIIRGDMSMNTRKKLYQIFSENMNFDLDVLLFVETMTEGWDGPIAKKLINASPTRAEWLMEQLFGRILRPYQRYSGELVTAEAVDLIDRSDSGQTSFTDILTRDGPEGMRYREGVTVGKDLADLSDPLRRRYGAYEPAA
jgi:superfamily II DNA or RNA helicase